jgi:hypothetical protein
MADPVGGWNINANGFKGTLQIDSDGSGHLSGTVAFDGNPTNTLDGEWNEVAQEVNFRRRGPQTLQTYTGYLFMTQEPILESEGPGPRPVRVLAGFFEGTGATPGRTRFGWVAKQSA